MYGLHSFKSQKVPNRSKTQIKIQNPQQKKYKNPLQLYDNFISKHFCIIEEDETYIKYDHQHIPDSVYYISKYRGEA